VDLIGGAFMAGGGSPEPRPRWVLGAATERSTAAAAYHSLVDTFPAQVKALDTDQELIAYATSPTDRARLESMTSDGFDLLWSESSGTPMTFGYLGLLATPGVEPSADTLRYVVGCSCRHLPESSLLPLMLWWAAHWALRRGGGLRCRPTTPTAAQDPRLSASSPEVPGVSSPGPEPAVEARP
jgi:hypothetical protein